MGHEVESARRARWLFWGASLGAALGLGLVAVVDVEGAPVVCPFRLSLELPCPGCGLTRAGAALVRGELVRSLTFHPFALLLAAEALVAWVVAAVAVERGRSLAPPARLENWALGHAAVLIALWLGRLAGGTLPF